MQASHAFLSIFVATLCGCSRTCEQPIEDSGVLQDDAVEQELSFFLSPDTAQAGEVFITSLVLEDDVGDFAYDRIEDLVFYGEVQVCTMHARGDELLVSIGVAGDAPSREVDLVVVMDDGETFFVDAALTILGGDQSGGGGTADGVMCAGG